MVIIFNQVKNFLFYCRVGREEYNLIRPLIWSRNIKALRLTALLSGVMGIVFLVLNVVLGSGVWFSYVFLFSGSLITLILLAIMRRYRIKNEWLRILLCYWHMILICVYASILSTQQSNYDIPATSIIVFIALQPLSIDDRPIRMYIVVLCESVGYLIVSYMTKSGYALSLDIMNVISFCPIGMILYSVICVRNVRELSQSERVERMQRNIIFALASVVEARDASTGGHILRTENYVERLTERMKKQHKYSQLTKDYYKNVILAAPMHDIGKIKIPDGILNKPGSLTEEEYEIMKKHSTYGAEIVRKTISSVEEKEYCDIAYNIAKYHHERYDGTGYPEGLKGEEIPIEARILALADVYDALISKRVYKEAYSREKAKRIIQEGSGTQFDPNLVPLFLECV